MESSGVEHTAAAAATCASVTASAVADARKKEKPGPRDNYPRVRELEPATPSGKPIEWMTARQAATQLLGITPNTVYDWIARGFGPPTYNFYGQWRYKRSEIEAWLETRRKVMCDPLFRVIGIARASQLIGVHENTLWRWINQDKGPAVFIFNGRYVYKETDVLAWIENHRGESGTMGTGDGATTDGNAERAE